MEASKLRSILLVCLALLQVCLARVPSQLDPVGEHLCDTLQSELVDTLAQVQGGPEAADLPPLPDNPADLGNHKGKGNCGDPSENPGNAYGTLGNSGNHFGALNGNGNNGGGNGNGNKGNGLGNGGSGGRKLKAASRGPITVLEVTKPVKRVSGTPTCSVTLMPTTNFGSSGYYNTFSGTYNPPAGCGSSWAQVVLTWTASVSGSQYDRFAGVWLGGVEILRTTTAEPVSNGVTWTVEKNITQYTALLKGQQSVYVELDNTITSSLTGIYKVGITFSFYAPTAANAAPIVADAVLPMQDPYGYQYGYWFGIQPGTYNNLANSLSVPTNTLRAIVEVYYGAEGVCSGTGCYPGTNEQEFWYTYPPDNSGHDPTGAFHEIRVQVDGKVVGVVWPFATIYTGGLNPKLWSPIVSIGAFLLPPMSVDITPFLSYFNDGAPHIFALDMGSTIGYYWLVDANVQLFLDPTVKSTTASLVSSPPSQDPDFINVNVGANQVSAQRTFAATGTVTTDTGVTYTTTVSAQYSFSNNQTYPATGGENWNQQTSFNTDVKTVTSAGATVYRKQGTYSYPMTGTYSSAKTTIDHSMVYTVTTTNTNGFAETVKLDNRQQASASSITSSSTNTYLYSDATGCYNRKVSSSGFSVTSDTTSGTGC